MTDFQFEDKGMGGLQSNYQIKPKTGAITKLLLKTGIIKDEKQAPMVLIIIMLVCFGLSIFFFVSAF